MKVTGILNINKPSGISSYDVVDIIKKIFIGSRIGHTGLLDPLSNGVLPILLGDATKLSNKLTSEDKAYRVKVLLGVATDTFDITGTIIFASIVDSDDIYIRERIKRFIGKEQQNQVEIYDINNIAVDLKKREVCFDVYCNKKTYIRNLVHDIGEKLGCGATMVDLTRLKNGSLDIKDSIDLYDFLKLSFEEMNKKIITIDEYYADLKKIYLLENDFKKFINGIKTEFQEQDKMVRIYNNNKYIGLGEIKDKCLKKYLIKSE